MISVLVVKSKFVILLSLHTVFLLGNNYLTVVAFFEGCFQQVSLFYFAVGWASDARGFGEQPGAKAQILNIVHATRTVMRGKATEK